MDQTQTTTWRRTATGGWLSPDGRWRVRGPIFGKAMYWLYHDGGRYTPTGRYDDVVNFPSARQARQYADARMA